MNIQLTDLITLWGADRIQYFLSFKIKNNILSECSWPIKLIKVIEQNPLFSKFENLSYEQMKSLSINCDLLFNEQTKNITNLIESIPHNYQLPDNNFLNEKCLIMVDASVKKNGNKTFYGIAGCIRNENGNIISGFALPIYSETVIDSTTLELMAIEEGTKLAHSYGLKNYTVVSDCISDAVKIHRLFHDIIPITKDYHNNEPIYTRIFNLLKQDQSNIAYIPRDYNNIADEYSKSYMGFLHKEFQKNELDTERESRNILSGNQSSINNIYFYHNNLKSYLENSPYDLEKNFQHNFVYDIKKHGQYELYVMPFYNNLTKKIYNYSFDVTTHSYEFLFDYVVNNNNEDLQASHFNNLDLLLNYCKDKKTAIFSGSGLVAKTNKIASISEKELQYYQKLYKIMNNVKEVSFFAHNVTMKNKIEKTLQQNFVIHKPEKLKM